MFKSIQRDSRITARILLLLTASLCWQSQAGAANYLGSAADFAVLGASTVTTTGVTTINGDIGVSPGTAFAVTGTLTHNGVKHLGDAVALLAQIDATNGFNAIAALTPTTNLTGLDLGTLGVLTPGLYRFDSSAQLTGTLTLDYASDPGGSFIFQIGSTLTTASAASVVTLNGSASSGLYWNVGSAATLGSGTVFAGNIIAQSAVTMNDGASILCGRAIALTAAVTMISNIVSNNCTGGGNYGTGRSDYGSSGFLGEAATAPVPEPGNWALMIAGFGLTGAAMRRRAAMVVA